MAQITISGMTVYKTRLPGRWKRRLGIGGVKDSFNNVIVKLDTDAGIVGWGEAATAPVFPGTTEAAVAALHVHLRPVLIGADPFRIEWLLERAEQSVMHCAEAKAAMEMALFDIVGKALKTPVYTLLGGAYRREIPLSFSVANPDVGEDLEVIQRLYNDGVRLFKIKTGSIDHRDELKRLERLRTSLPDDIDFRIDYNQALQPYDAVRRLRDIEQFRPTFIEQPVGSDKVEALAHISHAIDTPIMADESVFSAATALQISARHMVDLISIKVMKNGGMLRARDVSGIAQAAGIACYGGDMAESGIGHSAGTHLIAATPNISLGCEFYQATYYLQEDLLATPFPVKNGKVHVPSSPGLGIEVDEGRVEKYAVETYR